MAKVSNFNERFISLIEKTGQTDSVLAERLGVSKQAFSSWRNGRRSPTRTTIEHIADVFCVDVAWLMGYDDDPSNVRAVSSYSSFGTLTEDEQRLLMAYRNASDDLRFAAIAMLESFQGAGKKSPAESTGT